MEGDREMRYASKYTKMSMRKLKSSINDMVKEYNARVANMRADDIEYEAFNRVQERLEEYVGKAYRQDFGLGKGYAKAHNIYSDRKVAEEFAEELQSALSWDVFTEQGITKWEESREKAWKKFNKKAGREKITRADFDALTDMIESLGRIVDEFGSDQVVEEFNKYKKTGKRSRKKFIEIVKKARANAKGITVEQVLKEIQEQLGTSGME